MNTAHTTPPMMNKSDQAQGLHVAIDSAWSSIAPTWPLDSFVAVNPLQGFEDKPFEQAIAEGSLFFQTSALPEPMQEINRQTIKWLQAYTDQGQAVFKLPLKHRSLLTCIRTLLPFDETILNNDPQKLAWMTHLPTAPHAILQECLFYLGIKTSDADLFFTLLLTTLPGWAGYMKYLGITDDYLALRAIITCLIWPKAKALLTWHQTLPTEHALEQRFRDMIIAERHYRDALVPALQNHQAPHILHKPVQVVFCIDVRSEPMRRALEAKGHYETLGFAGFFGMPVAVQTHEGATPYASCPVLLKPSFTAGCTSHPRESEIRRIYQALKYNLSTPFGLAEIIGSWAGLGILLKNHLPSVFARKTIQPKIAISSVSDTTQADMAESALRLMGLTSRFSRLVVFCGHGSHTHNNAHAASLDCGACGGKKGGINAVILANILNTPSVRFILKTRGINIPETTHFIGAEHNTTRGGITLFDEGSSSEISDLLLMMKEDIKAIQDTDNGSQQARRSVDWSEVRPEWGLAKNAAMIIGPRYLSANLDLEARCFLHSYDHSQDKEGKHLATILSAPMVVAQWINSQYLFSTWDNRVFGAGSKITLNVTGKMGVMQGNASDLMHGLPLQSVSDTDHTPYHVPQRLLVIVYAPVPLLNQIVHTTPSVSKLIHNQWIHMLCFDPETKAIHTL